MMRVKMLNHDEGHAGIGRQLREQLLVGFQTSRRRANADNGKFAGGGLSSESKAIPLRKIVLYQ